MLLQLFFASYAALRCVAPVLPRSSPTAAPPNSNSVSDCVRWCVQVASSWRRRRGTK
jgi:hypothetical protein